jgi:predicted Rossmann fold flavoprotein
VNGDEPFNDMRTGSDVTVVVGGGAAGICAAISVARRGQPVVICEKTHQLGRKILASGNGRCNLLNDDLTEKHYNVSARPLVRSVFSKIGKNEILRFFRELGLMTYSQDGRVFPRTNQAASVLGVLEAELRRLSVPVETGFTCEGLSFSRDRVVVESGTGKKITGKRAILTAGGKTYPALGSDGSGFQIAGNLGHRIIGPVPSAVPLVVKDSLCYLLQGQRIASTVTTIIAGHEIGQTKGDVLFTKYGLSGTAILDASGPISIAMNRFGKDDVSVSVDMVPFMDERELAHELARRKDSNILPQEMLTGIVPNKLAVALKGLFGTGTAQSAAKSLKSRVFQVQGTRGWNEAEFTSGGIDTSEVETETLESKVRKGLYLAGEIIDVDGERGGYNLGWAWASGWVAGMAE